MRLLFELRFLPLILSALLSLAALAAAIAWPEWSFAFTCAFVGFAMLLALGLRDITQTRHAVLRNYPIAAHLRFLLESVRPEMRQYFFEGEKDGAPFPRDKRAIVYQRAKKELDKRPFGTMFDVYQDQYEWLHHSLAPMPPLPVDQMRVQVGSYSASLLNISAMSYGALSANAIRALNKGAKAGGFFHDTGEGGVSPYHREHGGDLVWEVGSGYFGCRAPDGAFDPVKFAENAADQDDRGETEPRRQTRSWRGAARRQGHGGNRRHPRRAAGAGLRLARAAFGLFHADGIDAVHRPPARSFGGQADRLQALHRP